LALAACGGDNRDQIAGSPGEARLRRSGDTSAGWSPATPPARRAGDEIRAPDTLVDAIFTRSRTWVRFPPSPLIRTEAKKREFGPVAAQFGSEKSEEPRTRKPQTPGRCTACYPEVGSNAPVVRGSTGSKGSRAWCQLANGTAEVLSRAGGTLGARPVRPARTSRWVRGRACLPLQAAEVTR